MICKWRGSEINAHVIRGMVHLRVNVQRFAEGLIRFVNSVQNLPKYFIMLHADRIKPYIKNEYQVSYPKLAQRLHTYIFRIIPRRYGFKLMFCQSISISVLKHYQAVSCSHQSTVLDPIKMKIENVTKYKKSRISNHPLLYMIHWRTNAVQTSKMS